MRFSIITPVFNSAQVVAGCVRSVLFQNFEDFEHIIIDNVSSDRTLDIIREEYANANLSAKLHIVSEPDNGISDAFNKGIHQAQGEVLLILNADDELYNKMVLSIADRAFSRPEILFVHGDMFFIDERYGTNQRKPLLCPITEAMPYNHPGMFIRRDVYQRYGGYLPEYKYAMDYEFILRLEKKIPDFRAHGFYVPDFPLTKTRAGGASWRNEIQGIKEVRSALKAHHLWNPEAQRSYISRVFRTRLKHTLNALGMRFVIKLWRAKKWNGKQ